MEHSQCRPQIGSHWANTFIHQPVANNGPRSTKSPPVDLLVWFAPRKDCELKVIDRLIDDPRGETCPNQVRYQWEGAPAIGEKLVFTQVYFQIGEKLVLTEVYYQHSPFRARATLNNPNPNTRAAYSNELQATAHASGIQIVKDLSKASVLRLELTTSQVEWVVFNPEMEPLQIENLQSASPFLYRSSSR